MIELNSLMQECAIVSNAQFNSVFIKLSKNHTSVVNEESFMISETTHF